MTGFNAQGYGVDATKDIVIYHRWGAAENGQLERFIIVLNFSAYDHDVNTYGFTPTGSTIEFYPANFRFGSEAVTGINVTEKCGYRPKPVSRQLPANGRATLKRGGSVEKNKK